MSKLRHHMNGMFKAILFMVVACITILIIQFFTEYAFAKYSTREYYFTYHEIIITNLTVDGALSIVSYATIKRPIDIQYIDVLRCNLFDGKGYNNYSQQPFNINNYFPTTTSQYSLEKWGDEATVAPWSYTSAIPKNGDCYIRGDQKTVLKHGNSKSMQTRSNEVRIRDGMIVSNKYE